MGHSFFFVKKADMIRNSTQDKGMRGCLSFPSLSYCCRGIYLLLPAHFYLLGGINLLIDKGGVHVSWKDKKKNFQQRMANMLDIPRDLMMDLPKIVIVGDVQVFIENHRGIIIYTAEQVKVNTTLGEVKIEGSDLTLKNILPDEIMVEGRIKSISFS